MKFFKSQPLSANVDTDKASTTKVPIVKAVYDWAVGLFTKGAASSTGNAIARFDGTTGKILKNSTAVVGDDGVLTANGVTLPQRGQRLTVATYGSISETVGGAAYINGNNIAASPTVANMVVKTTNQSDSGQYIGMRYDKGIYFCTGIGIGDAVGTTYNDGAGVSERVRINLNGDVGINTPAPTARLDVNGTTRFRGNATFNGQFIDNVGSSGVDGQVLKKVGGQVLWSNP